MQKYTAIILASHDIGEFDRLYILYTLEQGLLKAVAKGVRKPAAKLAGHLEPGTLSEVYIAKSRGMGQITSAITLETFSNVKKDFEKLSEFLKISRFLLKNFSEGEKDKKIFKLLEEFLKLADQKNTAQSLALGSEAFWWKLFDALGNRPEVLRCVACGEKLRSQSPINMVQPSNQGSIPPALREGRGSSRSNLRKFFSVEKGGAVCSGCRTNTENAMPISDNQIKLLRIFWGNPLQKIAKVKIGPDELSSLAGIRENFRKYNF